MYLDVTQLFPEATADMERVEKLLLVEVKSGLPFMTEVASYLLTAGGKRIRPGLAIACASIADSPIEETTIQGGAAVELVHLGSLHHDDVIDSAATRRNVKSVNANWDTLTAVLSGDFLLARASAMAASISTDVSKLLADTIGELCEGQIREHQDSHDSTRTIESYELSIWGKTASLLSTSCKIGAMTAELTDTEISAVADFGRSYGMAFQIIDDINDVIGHHTVLGKPAGQDVIEGNYTLPLLLTLQSAAGDELNSLLGNLLKGKHSKNNLDENLEQVLQIVRSGSGIDEATDTARVWAKKAVDALVALRDSPAANRLRQTASDTLNELPRFYGTPNSAARGREVAGGGTSRGINSVTGATSEIKARP